MKPILTILILSIPWVMTGQSDSPHDKLRSEKDVITLSMDIDLEDFLDDTLEMDDDQLSIEGDAERIEVSYISDEANTSEIYHMLTSEMHSSDLEEIEIENEEHNKSQIYLWLDRNGDHVSTIHVLVLSDEDSGDGFVFATVHGDFTIED